MDVLVGTVPLDGQALLGQEALMGSVGNSAAALDSNAGLTGMPNAVQSPVSRGVGVPFESSLKLLPTVAAADKPDVTTPSGHGASVSDLNNLSFARPVVQSEPAIADNGTPAVDPLTGIAEGATLVGSEVNGKASLDLAIATAQKQLKSFATNEEFLDKMKLAFGEDWQPQAARALIQDLTGGEVPNIEVLPTADLDMNGAFGKNTIYLSEKFLSKNADNPELVAGVLLEEIGHYVDQELGSNDSPGDEGDIFARLVQGETIGEAELSALTAEDDSATIALNGEEIAVELAHEGEPSLYQGMSANAAERWANSAATVPPYPGYNLVYDPSAPEYNEDPAVVQLWQQRVKDLGYDITVDGSYGEQSKAVAIAFQQEKGLAADGIVGPATWGATFSADVSEPSPYQGMSADAAEHWIEAAATTSPNHLLKYEPGVPLVYDPAVEQWQQGMKDRGWHIDVDGLYGPQSKQIASQFQQEQGLAVDGIVGPDTWAATFSPVTSPSTEAPSPEPQLPQTSPSPSVVPQVGPPEMSTVTVDARPLNSQELEIAKSVFGESINYDQVQIEEAWLLDEDRPYTRFNTIVTSGPIEDDVLIHELTHSWQYQQYGAEYIPGALGAQWFSDEGYDYGDVAELQSHKDAGQGITSFNVEQQAALVQDYYRLREGLDAREDSSATQADLPVYAHFVDEVSTLSEPDLLGDSA